MFTASQHEAHRAHEPVDLMMAPDESQTIRTRGEPESIRGELVVVVTSWTHPAADQFYSYVSRLAPPPASLHGSVWTERKVTHTHSWLNAAGVFSPVSSTCITHTHTGTWGCVGLRIFSLFRFIRGLFEVSGGLWF